MYTQEKIIELCKAEGISVSALEKELGFSNGSLKKDGFISSDRLYAVAKRFGVTMEELMEQNPSKLDLKLLDGIQLRDAIYSNTPEGRKEILKALEMYLIYSRASNKTKKTIDFMLFENND